MCFSLVQLSDLYITVTHVQELVKMSRLSFLGDEGANKHVSLFPSNQS